MKEIRKHYFLDRWVIFSDERSRRPSDYEIQEVNIRRGSCYFHPENVEGIVFKLGEPWKVAVIRNKFPMVSEEARLLERGGGLLEAEGGFGYHEVVIEGRDHREFHNFTNEQALLVVRAYIERTKAHLSDGRIKYVSIFKNKGVDAGASIVHPHSQIVSLPVVPRLVFREHGKIEEYSHLYGECPFRMIYEKERKTGRIILEGKDFYLLAPYSSVFPGEMWLVPRRHVRTLPELRKDEQEEFASMLVRALRGLNRLFPGVAYNFSIHQAPRGRDFHLHLEIYPRLSKFAGFELGNDMYVNALLPERFAAEFREVMG